MNNALVSTYFSRLSGTDHWGSAEEIQAKELLRQFLAAAVNMKMSHSGTLYQIDRDASMASYADAYTDEVIDTVTVAQAAARYEDGVSLYVEIRQLETDTDDIQYPLGMQGRPVLAGVAPMTPRIYAGDVWYDSITEKMYKLKPVQYLAQVSGVPVLAALQMHELEDDAPEYGLLP
jgi:hypothetical protein